MKDVCSVRGRGAWLRILLSNDDGIKAEGLEALIRVFSSRHDVVVSAPMTQQSGMSHALTVRKSMEVSRDLSLEQQYGIEAWCVDGTPTDCVKLYLEALAAEKPDVVISGINHGANLATDILYSGTVGGAMEGFLHDISSFAVSLDVKSQLTYDDTARVFLDYVEKTLCMTEMPIFYNVNFPKAFREGNPTFVFGRQGKRDYLNAFQREERSDGRIFYSVAGEIFDTDKSEPTDIYAVEAGYVAVTPLMTDMTNYMMLEKHLEG